jgi:GR25 family glycosyltransferase involved in LPS biosynthesis
LFIIIYQEEMFKYFILAILILIVVVGIVIIHLSKEKKYIIQPRTTSNIDYFCISLNYRQKKYETVRNTLARQNIDVVKFAGIEGKKLPFETFDRGMMTPSYKNHFLKTPKQKGHLGATFSHAGVWQDIIDNKRERTVIFEDDVLVDPDFSEQLQDRLQRMDLVNPDWDILLLGFSCSYDSYGKCHKNDNIPIQQDKIVEVKIWMGLWAYVVNGHAAASRIMKNIFPLKWHIDHHLANLIEKKQIKVYGSIPSIGMHPGSVAIDSWKYTVARAYHGYVSDTGQ